MKYKNITVSSLPGSGSSTLAKKLAEILNFKYFCGGDFMRAYAIEHGLFDGNKTVHHDASAYDDEFDRQVDFQMRTTAQKAQGNIMDAWLSGFMTQGVENTLKVLLYCSENAVRVDRLVNRDKISIKQAKKHIFQREEKNLSKWRKIYNQEWQEWVVARHPNLAEKEIYFWYPEIYDLTIDTYKYGPEETVEMVMAKIKE